METGLQVHSPVPAARGADSTSWPLMSMRLFSLSLNVQKSLSSVFTLYLWVTEWSLMTEHVYYQLQAAPTTCKETSTVYVCTVHLWVHQVFGTSSSKWRWWRISYCPSPAGTRALSWTAFQKHVSKLESSSLVRLLHWRHSHVHPLKASTPSWMSCLWDLSWFGAYLGCGDNVPLIFWDHLEELTGVGSLFQTMTSKDSG